MVLPALTINIHELVSLNVPNKKYSVHNTHTVCLPTHPVESSPHVMDHKHEQTEPRDHEHIHEEPAVRRRGRTGRKRKLKPREGESTQKEEKSLRNKRRASEDGQQRKA